ncbi:hypothetical protein GOHSU_02_00280 [Gordonia hirsuta DSM 44140 = NBRC 16056]|uniref:Phosphatidic acid phosphatase type 2/haloperoxidase domain-containing protein n=1 Tax=Gordonia hirsuta DSM 44140 = NBRC 16056 TaxID=1121927 RepID=L7L409_9ACTN|nr:phosphatase PAP2 family protein [Gordonia hirsuta]GAC55885.1 hypothetical protein GOHSU_02_00280 [Gordonia hirsuta DSM 44140 = NBRC 16056]
MSVPPPVGVARWWGLTIGSLLVLVAVYLAAVRTPTGQRVENQALSGARQVNADELAGADQALATFTVSSLGVAVAILAIIGWLRGGLRLAAIAVAVVAGAVMVAEVLKRVVLTRPPLVEAPEYWQHNSFPSGHTTVAMSVACASLIVVSWRWRTLAMLVVMSWTVGVGAYTVVARWHRLSDTIGADAIALAAASIAALVLVRTGQVQAVPADRKAPVRTVLIVLATLYVVAMGAIGIALGVVGMGQEPGSVAEYNVYLAAQSLASVGSVLAILLAWWSWHRLESV